MKEVNYPHSICNYSEKLIQLLNQSRVKISTIKPSQWTEENVIMGKPFPGPFSYERTPYTREIVDRFSPDDPAKIIAVMKGAQVGFSAGVLYPAVGYIIQNNPGNTLFMVGHESLEDETMNKIDRIINSANLRHLIRPTVKRNRAGKTGDTNKMKEFPGGYLVVGNVNNHKILRQRDMQYGIIDDYEAVKNASKESGSTRKLFEQRFAAYADDMKLAYISTPELKETSNIEPAYLLGDQRKYNIPCPCCGEFIDLRWSTHLESDETVYAGITYKVDDLNRIVKGSVGYICHKCGDFFTDSKKHELLNAGFWVPTTEPSREGYYSYHLSSLYAPPGMYDWQHYAQDYVDANPPEGRDEKLYQAFVNLALGQTYIATAQNPEAKNLQKNIRNYDVGIIPESTSIKDGNGLIILITCACDLNGNLDDARLDYEILAWSAEGASYSIDHGSIGTFIPREGKNKADREYWTYQMYKSNSVWPALDSVLSKKYQTDTGRNMMIYISGIDCGYHSEYAYEYLDRSDMYCVGLKGQDVSKYVKLGMDVKNYKIAKNRNDLYLVQVGQIKNDLSRNMRLKWDSENDPVQHKNFMNFPLPSEGKFLYNNYFSHFESEQPQVDSKSGMMRWVKKTGTQNHMWDCRVYNIVLKDILVDTIGKELKRKEFTWEDLVEQVTDS